MIVLAIIGSFLVGAAAGIAGLLKFIGHMQASGR
jgi:hypothetical protein